MQRCSDCHLMTRCYHCGLLEMAEMEEKQVEAIQGQGQGQGQGQAKKKKETDEKTGKK